MSDLDEGKNFSASFFGAKPDSFIITRGLNRELDMSKYNSNSFLDYENLTPEEISQAIAGACVDDTGAVKATPQKQIAETLFGDSKESTAKLNNALQKLSNGTGSDLNIDE